MCCTVSVSIPQNLQDGSPLNRPMIRRRPFTGACPVRIATTIFSWCLPNLSRSSATFLHGLPMKSLPCLQSGISFQVLNLRVTVLDEFSLYPTVFDRILFMKYLYEVSCIWYKLHTVKRQYLCVRLTNAVDSKSVSTNKELHQFCNFHVLCTEQIYKIFKKTNKCTWVCGYIFIIQ